MTLFTEEYGVEYSLLRTDDSLKLFVKPIRQGNPVEAFFSQAAVQDRASELNYRLKERRKLLAQPLEKAPIACAIASRTAVIVSRDKHLLHVSGWGGIEVLTPLQVLDRYIAE